MQIPKKVKIGPHVFTVQLVDVVNKLIPRRGEVDHEANTSRLDKTMAQSKIEECFLHEILHELDEELVLGLGEERVGRVSYALYGVLVDNKMLK